MSHLVDSVLAFFSVWHTVRAAGLTSYLLLFLAVSAGLIQSLPVTPVRLKPFLAATHTTAGWIGLLFGLVHGLILRFDHYIGYSLSDIFIPFMSQHEPLATTAGIISLYLMLLIMASSDWRTYINRKLWRILHVMSYPAYLLALYHGLVLGTDTNVDRIWLMYVGTASVTAVLFLIRLLFSLLPVSFARVFPDNRRKTNHAETKKG